ncbi:MAG: thymidine kinase [Deltaproteobacteria bacterium]|nr:thymidine kinase [Deltaproteobacteria bacterium]
MNPHMTPRGVGWIEVVTGCMFSGKTEELIRRVRRAQYANQPVVVFKPAIDTRYAVDSIGSHMGGRLRSFQVGRSADIPSLVGDAMVVAIDEAQFLDDGLVEVCERLANGGLRVIVAGLDLDYRAQPFGPMPHMMAVAEYVQKTLAICVVCGNPADRSQRIVNRDSQVLVGETDAYEARCRLHFDPNNFQSVQERLPFGRNLAEETADEVACARYSCAWSRSL